MQHLNKMKKKKNKEMNKIAPAEKIILSYLMTTFFLSCFHN